MRAEPYAAQVPGGNVLLVKGAWNKDFIDENTSFPVDRARISSTPPPPPSIC